MSKSVWFIIVPTIIVSYHVAAVDIVLERNPGNVLKKRDTNSKYDKKNIEKRPLSYSVVRYATVRGTPENIIVTNWNARTRPPTGLWAFYV